MDFPKRLGWDTFGETGLESDREKKFLSEAGDVSVHKIWQLCECITY